MHIKAVLDKANSMGDFYVVYTKATGRGRTYLVGTADFDNKYILATGKKANDERLHSLGAINAYAEDLKKEGKVLLFSWTNNKFRAVRAANVTRMTPLQAEMKASARKQRVSRA